jgi:acetylornithine deacetylase
MIDSAWARETARKILQDLVRIPSVNPDLAPNGTGEAAMAKYICDWMASWGLEVINQALRPNRHNAIGILRGSGGGQTLLFNGHTDTVSVEGMSAPFSGDVRDGRLYGRGSFDMKGSLAATLAATQAIVQSGKKLRGDVIFTYVADEEYLSIGTEAVVADIQAGRLPRPDAAINTEPTDCKMGIGHKGFAWIDIETHGIAAHGSRPDLGVDAIAQMGKVLVELQRLQQKLSKGKRHELLGTGSVHASLIHGGRELSSYPDACKLQVERRTVPPESRGKVEREMASMTENLSRADPTFKADYAVSFVRNPWQADLQSDIVKTMKQVVKGVTGKAAKTMTQTGWLDSALLGDAGIPTIVFGPKGQGAHAVEEWVDVESLGVCAQVYAEAMERFCG